MATFLVARPTWWLPLLLLLGMGAMAAAESARPAEPPPIRLRVEWGGGEVRAWSGRIELLAPPAGRFSAARPPQPTLDWSLLSSSPASGCALHQEGNALVIHEPQPQAAGGVELQICEWATARLRVQLMPTDAGPDEPGVIVDETVAALLRGETLQPLDARGNRLTLAVAAGDLLRVQVAPPADPAGWQPAAVAQVTAQPLLPARPTGFGRMELAVTLADVRSGATLHTETQLLTPAATDAAATLLQVWQPVAFDCPLPDAAGRYRLTVTAVERSSLRWSRTLLSCSRELVVNSPRAAATEPEPWELVYELDPGSPRLHERLRRLPGQAAASMASMRRLSLPAMPMPSLTRAAEKLPDVSLPKVPLPALPKVPSIDGLIPTLSGLLSTGDSSVEPHALGVMLTLPPAAGPESPTWEGVVIADAQPGRPHAVEIAYPSDQEAVVGVSVLEQPAGATAVELRYDGGFTVPPPLAGEPPQLRWHRFVFWPRTRTPMVMLTNPSRQRSATVGRVRVLRGPATLAAVDSVADGPPGRRIFVPLPRQAVGSDHGTETPAATAANSTSWVTWYESLEQTAQRLRRQQVTGLAVEVHAGGASLWRSGQTVGGPRWDEAGDAALTEAGDRLDLLCRICRQQEMRLIPTLRFDGVLPQLETQLAAPGTSAGLLCVGRDGQLRDAAATPAGRHYNILDPRVQAAVADVLGEVVARLASNEMVDGVAVTLPSTGWLHLPGVAWGLDDITFTRFVRETAQGRDLLGAAGPDRFAARAAAVEGRLRQVWLSWRADQVATFHRQLADMVGRANAGWNYYIMPTSLLHGPEIAERFRPTGVGQPAAGAVLYECGIDPGRLTLADNAVYVAARLHTAAEELTEAATVSAINQSEAVAAWEDRSRRHGLLLLEQPQPLALEAAVPHGPFKAKEMAAAGQFHAVAGGPTRQAALLTGLVGRDAEIVFDQSLRWADLSPADAAVRQAFCAVPVTGGQPLAGMPAEFPVTVFRQDGNTWVTLTNATRLPAQLELQTGQPVTAATDAVSGEAIAVTDDRLSVPLDPWSLRLICLEGDASAVPVERGTVRFSEDVVRIMTEQVADLRRRQAVLEAPPPLTVLDNPSFDLPVIGAGVTGWELVEASGGFLEVIAAPQPETENGKENRAARLTSTAELATIRSNPFAPPAAGRASIAVWLRVPPDSPQPPLRVAIEGLKDGEEYYRFAPVGAAPGGRPLTEAWTRFVLQVNDLPTAQTDSVRLRFDMLGPGVVDVDDVQVFDLVFAEAERAQVRTLLDQMEHALAAGTMASLPTALEGYWPRFLTATVTEEQAAIAEKRKARRAARRAKAETQTAENPDGFFDRVRNWGR